MSSIREQLRESAASVREVFRNPGLARVNVALGGSVMGDWAYGVAVSVYAYLEGGATAVGILGVVRYVSAAVVTPFAATLADRLDRKQVMIASDVIRFVLVALIAGIIAVDGSALAVYGLALAATLASTAFRPAQAAVIPRLARHPDELTAANVTSSTIESLGFFAGPAIAGLLLAVTDIEIVFAFNAVTFVWSALVLRGLVIPPVLAPHAVPAPVAVPVDAGGTVQPVEATPGTPLGPGAGEPGDPGDPGDPGAGSAGFLVEASEGFRTILRNRHLRLLVAVYSAQTVVAGASLVFTVAIALDLLELGEASVGLFDAAIGVGGLVGGVVALLLAQRGTLARDFGFGVLAWSAPLLLVAAVPQLWATILAMVVIGLANAVVDVNAFTVMQRLVPDEVMGRVFGAMESAIIAAMAVGSLAMPMLIVTVGLRSGLAVIGGTVVAVTLLALRGLREIDRVALAPAGLDLLRAVTMLSPLEPRVLERLARSSEVHRFAAGETIFAEGDAGDRFYIVETGEVEVRIGGARVGAHGPGGCFGEIALLRDVPRTATVQATTDVVCRSLRRDVFVPAVTGHGDAQREADSVVSGWMGSV
jgi:MFS family permease